VEPESLFGDLDHILLDQLHNAKQSRKIIKRAKKLLPNDPLVHVGEELVEKRIQFFESMVSDKSLLHKRHKRKKKKELDILAKNPVWDWYKTVFMATTFGYKMFTDSVSQYMSYFKKGKQ
jgi:hypothetical protein